MQACMRRRSTHAHACWTAGPNCGCHVTERGGGSVALTRSRPQPALLPSLIAAMASVLSRVSVVRAVAQQPAPQKRGGDAAPRVTRRSAGLFAAALLLRSGAADASFREDANEKALAKAALLEATRAKAEGRAPRVVTPAPAPAAAAKGKAPAAPKPEATTAKREAPMKAKAVEEVRAVRLRHERRVIALTRVLRSLRSTRRRCSRHVPTEKRRCSPKRRPLPQPLLQLQARRSERCCVVSLCVSTRAGLCPAEALEDRRVCCRSALRQRCLWLCLQLCGC